MQEGKTLMDKSVVSVDEGRLVGTIKSLYVDRELTTLRAVGLAGKGMFNRQKMLVQREPIVMFGRDALFVKQSNVAVEDGQLAEFGSWLRLADLKGRRIETPGGTKIGTIGDILHDQQGQILGFTFDQLLVQGTLADKGYLSRGCVVEVATPEELMTIDLTKAEQQTIGQPAPTVDSAEPVNVTKEASEVTHETG